MSEPAAERERPATGYAWLRRHPAEVFALAGVLAVTVLVPLIPGRVPLGSFPGDAITLSLPLAILFAVPLLRKLGARGLPPVGLQAAALVFLAIALVSVVFSHAPGSAFATWARYAGYFALVVVVAAATRDWWSRRIVMWSLVLAGSVTCVQGLYQYLHPDVRQAIGLQGLDVNVVATRVFATFDNPNFYAEFLVLLFAVTLALVLTEKWRGRVIGLPLLGLQAIVLGLTYTRASWLALAVGLAVTVLIIDARWMWAFLALGAAFVAAVPGGIGRLASAFSLEGTASFRLRLWAITGQIIARYPWAGVGIGRFYDAFREVSLLRPDLATGFLTYGAHNSYYALMAETGVLGGLAFVWIVVSVVRMGLFYAPRMRADRMAFLANAALTAGLIAFAINATTSNAFQHPRGAIFFWLVAGLQAGIGAKYWAAAAERRPAHAKGGVVSRVWGASLPGRATDTVFVRVLHLPAMWRASGAGRLVAGLPRMWSESVLDHWLLRAPVGGATLLQRSPATALLLGRGADDDALSADAAVGRGSDRDR
jgi:putative inorganic carbon (HCO3(-)) transporter